MTYTEMTFKIIIIRKKRNDLKTLILNILSLQFVLPHSRGSSHGPTRIIRKAYEKDFYVRMMEESYELWALLEKEAGVKLYRCVSVWECVGELIDRIKGKNSHSARP